MVRRSVGNYPVHTIYNGLPISEIKNISEQIPNHNTKAILDQIDGYRTIVQVGALDRNKNQMFTLERLAEIRYQLPNVRLLLIGEGKGRSQLIEFVLANGLEKQVIFAGKMKRLDCLYLMSRATLLVLTSDSESFPNVIAEAQALSLPVITFDVGAVREIVHQGVTGFVVRTGDKQEFRKKMIELLTNDHLATMMGKMGKQRVTRRFSMDKKVDFFLSYLYNDLKLVKKNYTSHTI
jgi:glycosyltransferase involved in cell wall biosynthesis